MAFDSFVSFVVLLKNKKLNKNPTYYLPFEDLLKQLKQQGLHTGPDIHIRIQKMLNAQENTSIEDLKYQLGAIIARSEVELNTFYQLFDEYVEKHTYHPPKEKNTPSIDPTGEWKKRLPRILAFTPLFAAMVGTAIWWFFLRPAVIPFECPKEDEYTISANISGSGRYNQEFNFQFQSIRSEKEGFEEHLTSENVRLEWELGDGTMLMDSSKTYRYANAGYYEPELRVIINDSCICRTYDSLSVKIDDRIRPNFTVQSIASDSFRFEEKSYYFSSPDSLHPSDTTNVSFLWEFGDGQTSTERNPTHKYEDLRDYTVKLTITADWPDTNVTATQTRQVSNMPKPDLGFLPLEDENISDLLPPKDRNFWPFILTLSLLISYLIYEAIRAWQRKIALEEAPLKGPPLRQPLELDPPTLDFLNSQDFYELSRSLRRRRAGRGNLRPNIRRSIDETAQAGGFPTLEWHKRTRPSQYLILIKEDSKYDHLVQLFAAMAKEWESRDISVAFYTYERNPRLCKRINGKRRLPLSQLHNLYPNDRLIVIGEGEELLSEEGDSLADWTEDFDPWTQRAWLSSKSTEAWGQSEHILSRKFLILPATQTGMQSLVAQWEADQQLEPQWWKRNHFELAIPDPESTDIISELKIYLGEAGFQWLAACAWYPELRWELSLQLGKLIEAYHPDAPIEELDHLLHVLRLSYFREGSMSRELREKLVAELTEKQSKAVREHLLALLEEERNQPPPDSYAAVDQQVRIALFRYLNSEKDGQAQKALRDAIKDLEPEDIEDQISLSELSKIKNSPLALILPARYFRGHVPFFGLRQKFRMLLVGIPLFLMAILGYYMSFWANKATIYDAATIYTAGELQLDDANDTARWQIHNGFIQSELDSTLIADGGISRGAVDSFRKAMLLTKIIGPEPGPVTFKLPYILDSTFLKALNNYSLSYYNYAVYAYQHETFQTAIDSLQPIRRLLDSLDSARRASEAQFWLPYAVGMSHLRRQESEAGVLALKTIFCDTLADRVYQQRTLNNLMLEEDVRNILQLLNATNSTAIAEALLRCIGGTYAYEVAVYPARELRTNVATPVYLQINGITNDGTNIDMEVRIMDGVSSYINLVSFTQTFRNFDYLGEIQSIELSLPSPQDMPRVDDWKGERITIRDLQTNQTYDFCPIGWIGDEERGRRRNVLIPVGCTTNDPEPAVEEDSTVVIPYTIAIQNNLGEPLPTANVQINGATQRLYTGAFVRDTLQVSVAQLDNLRRLNTTIPATKLLVSADGYLTSEVDVLIPLVNDTMNIKLVPIPPSVAKDSSDVPRPLMIDIKGGTYPMGNQFEGEGYDWEKPVHNATVSDFLMGAYEVSFAEYDRFCDSTGHRRPNDSWGRGQQPVMNVDWYDAILYCNWLSEKHGYEQVYTIDSTRQDPNNNSGSSKNWLVTVNWNANGYRLPTEAEWEYAARERGKKVRFGNGRDTADATQMNFYGLEDAKQSYSKVGEYRQQTVEVNSLRPNALGLYNMSGNVDEWCWDWYDSDYYSQSQGARNPRGPSSGEYRVLRGGAWSFNPDFCRAAYRYWSYPYYRVSYIGFRLLRRSR